MKNKLEEIDRKQVMENIGYHDKEIRMHAQGNPGPGPKGYKKDSKIYIIFGSLLFLLAWLSCVSVFWEIIRAPAAYRCLVPSAN